MNLAAGYLCPARGLAGLEPPQPDALRRVGGAAAHLDVGEIVLPVPEEALLRPGRARTAYLDGLIEALEAAAEARLKVVLAPLSQRVLGLTLAPPDLVRPLSWGPGRLVLVDGQVRNLKPLPWWTEPGLIERRLSLLRELLAALAGHPAIGAWLLEGWLEFSRPTPEPARLVLLSFRGEIRDRDEASPIRLGLSWRELLEPALIDSLAGLVDGLDLTGLEKPPTWPGLEPSLAGELLAGAYLATLANWLWDRPISVELGWRADRLGRVEAMIQAAGRLARRDPAALRWPSLVDPRSGLAGQPPWGLRPGLEKVGLLGPDGEPKAWAVDLLQALRSTPARPETDFLDLDQANYRADPAVHLARLWEHFR